MFRKQPPPEIGDISSSSPLPSWNRSSVRVYHRVTASLLSQREREKGRLLTCTRNSHERVQLHPIAIVTTLTWSGPMIMASELNTFRMVAILGSWSCSLTMVITEKKREEAGCQAVVTDQDQNSHQFD